MTEQNKLICRIDELSDPGSRGFSYHSEGEQQEGFIVKNDGQFFAYRNACPHTGSELDWVEHQFLDADSSFIQCAVHEACFQIDSGECVSGPCVGDKLDRLAIEVADEGIYLA